MAWGRFLDAVDPEIKAGIFRLKPLTLQGAVRAGLIVESFLRVDGAQECTSSMASHAQSIDGAPEPEPMEEDARMEDSDINLSDLVNKIKYMDIDESTQRCK